MGERETPPLEPDDVIDEAGMESFPASDPPPYWARRAADETPADRAEKTPRGEPGAS